MAQTTANADAVLKEYYLTPIREQLNNRCVLMFAADDEQEGEASSSGNEGKGQDYEWRGFTRESEGVQFAGKEWLLPAHTGRNEGIGAIPEGGNLPTAGQQGWTDLKDKIHHNLGSIRLSRFAIKLSNRDAGAFLKLLDAETKGMVKDLRKDVNRQGYGQQTGQLAKVTADGANIVTVDTVQFLRIGMVIDIVKITTNAILAESRTIEAINAASKEITYSGVDVTATAEHRLVRHGSWKNEINGLGNIVANTTEVGGIKAAVLHGVDPATNSWWNSPLISAAGNPFSEDQGQQLVDKVGAGGQSEVELIITTRGIRRRYTNTLKSQKRFNDNDSVTLRGGFKAILFNEMPMVFDDDCPKGEMWFLNADAMMWIYLDAGEDGKGGWNWVDDDGAILSRAVDRTDNFDAYLAADHDFATVGRNRLGRMVELQDDAAPAWS